MDGLSVGGATIPQPLEGILAAVRNKNGATVTRKESKTSMRLRKNGVLPYQAAVWCAETVGDRVRVTRPCAGWIDKADIIEGQIVVVSAAGGANRRGRAAPGHHGRARHRSRRGAGAGRGTSAVTRDEILY